MHFGKYTFEACILEAAFWTCLYPTTLSYKLIRTLANVIKFLKRVSDSSWKKKFTLDKKKYFGKSYK